MELELHRFYSPKGTNGVLLLNKKIFCLTIELPWNNNERNISCIPEGRYELVKRFSKKFAFHMLVKNVPGRDLILVHIFNNAAKESHGCIAPVERVTGPGRGLMSKAAFNLLRDKVYAAIDNNDPVFLTIKKQDDEKVAA